jgi:hypothetical protein
MDKKLIDALLFEEESTTLDFKQEQYPFTYADNEKKVSSSRIYSHLLMLGDGLMLIFLLELKKLKGGKVK